MRLIVTLLLLAMHLSHLEAHLPAGALKSWQDYSLGRSPISAAAEPAANNQAAALPVITSAQPLNLSAKSAYAADVTTGQPLFAQNAATTRPVASITKMMTALVIAKSHDLKEIVNIKTIPAYKPEDEKLGLTVGQRFTVNDLLKAAMIASDNDAADALAIYDSGSKEQFALKMNALAAEWGIKDVHFSNPTGLVDQDNFASAEALAKIGSLLLKNPGLEQMAATSGAQISEAGGRTYNLTSTNQLLQNGEFTGIKTGYTPAAGESLVGLTNINGHQVITVVLGSSDRFGDSQALAGWLQRSFMWQ